MPGVPGFRGGKQVWVMGYTQQRDWVEGGEGQNPRAAPSAPTTVLRMHLLILLAKFSLPIYSIFWGTLSAFPAFLKGL